MRNTELVEQVEDDVPVGLAYQLLAERVAARSIEGGVELIGVLYNELFAVQNQNGKWKMSASRQTRVTCPCAEISSRKAFCGASLITRCMSMIPRSFLACKR